MSGTPSPLSRDLLVAGLHARGVCYLSPTPHGDEATISDIDLISELADSNDARLRFSLAALLLQMPELGPMAVQLAEAAEPAARAELARQHMAACYLQRLWHTRLTRALGPRPMLREHFGPELGLPPASAMHGKLGLSQLSARGIFNDWSSFEQVVDMLCDTPCHAPTEVEHASTH